MFPTGTARAEIQRRKDARLRRGEEDSRAQSGVEEEIAQELIDGRGLGIVLRAAADEPEARAA